MRPMWQKSSRAKTCAPTSSPSTLPRKGLAADVVESIAEMQPGRVVYVSCDSATMARDVKRLADLGYTAQRACAVDMFPRADHVEAVCLLTKE
ncbi:MAG: hypothetical protein ACLRSD_16900 [Oscillibacter sp.]